MANEVKWIKISTGVFDDEAFQMIDDMPERDAIELIWFKLLVLAGKQNNHGLFLFKNAIPYTDEMLSSIFHRPINTVKLAMKTLEEFHLIETIDDVYSIPRWDDYQSLDGFDKSQEKNRLRQQRFREKQRALLAEQKENENSNVTDNVTSRYPSYSYSISNSNSLSFSNSIKEIIDYLNIKTNKRYTYSNKSINRYITGRLNDGFTVDDFKTVIDKKYDEWIGTEFEQYLKPTTLFAPSHFEEYLNQPEKKKKDTAQERRDLVDSFVDQVPTGLSF